MAYQHGISIQELATPVTEPIESLSSVQVVIGTAPVNLLADPAAAVNKPIVVHYLDEAKAAVGYSDDFDNYTLCQSIDACFNLFGVSPLVLINVLDPAVHNVDVPEQTVAIVNNSAKVNTFGVLLDNTFVVKDSTGTTTYSKGTDYTVSFDADGYPIITVVSTGDIPSDATQLKVTCKKIDPSKVTETDIIGSYISATGTYKGIECVQQVFPRLALVPGLLLAPGWSHKPEVKEALNANSSAINGCFSAEVVLDVDCSAVKDYTAVASWKTTNGYTDKRDIVLWPKLKVGSKIYWYSAVMAALISYTDAQNNSVPYKSPSNKVLPIDATVLADGTEIYLDMLQANELNGNGIVTAINMAGWRSWGNNTGIYPSSTDVKDRFIPVRRIFDWWGNSFIVDFFSKADDPTNYRLIESVVDDENIKANGYQAAGQIAGAKIEFRQQDNPISAIQGGQIQFIQSIGAFPPAENIIDVLQFDPNILQAALFGGGQ
ncbi:phage tail protein [Desulfosporosinus sp. FKB]|uniref:phage tail sheath family protein n=1 Tax=Desulfosporosinus sp. FKB TaxID=1969835 RepID=UPI000B499AD2|nr:phage tail protein [Desulfosporosinus sp. FKB]